MTIKKIRKKCDWCGDPVFDVHSMYCRECAHLNYRMKERRFPPEAVEGIGNYIRTYGKVCFYSKLPLVLDDIRSPWYCVFDHMIPLDPTKIVMCCALINEIKTALSVKEFWYYVEQLADYFDNGKKIRKIELAFWRQHSAGEERQINISMAQPKWKGKHKKCCLCGKPVFTLRSKYCRSCSHFARRLELQGFEKEAIQEIFDYVKKHGFTCAYTGIELDMSNPRSPWYGVFNLLTPKDRSKAVLTCALFNEMKSDLSISEFRYYIRQLANLKRYGTPIRKKELVYWYRLTLQELYLKSLRD